jgi:hypothetical protein
MRFALLITISLLLAWPSQGQDLYSTGSCEPAQAETYLETGNVRARVFNNGALFWKGSPNVYEVPKGSDIQAVFNANLLVAGVVDGEVRAAGSLYGPYEYWSGPIPADGSAPTDCSRFDRFWKLDYGTDFGRVDAETSPTPSAIEWPVELGAEFIDRNDVPGYQPDAGDIPVMNGDTQLWWIMNDRGNIHQRSDTAPLAVEVRASAFGFDVTNDLGNVTFYRYHIVNRGLKAIEDMAVGLFQDVDLGAAHDDVMGTDTTLAMLYVYNAGNMDEYQFRGYGESPPAIGFTVLEASHSAGTLPTDLGLPAAAHLTSARNMYGGGGPYGDPGTAMDIYHYMTGRWKNGEPMTEGENGVNFSDNPMPFWMPGDPVEGTYWSGMNTDGRNSRDPGQDRRSNLSFGVFDLEPGEWARFTFAIVWARGTSNLDSISELRRVAGELHASKADILAPRLLKPALFEDGNPPEEPKFPFWVDEPYPNPADDRLTLRASFDKSGPVSIRIIDTLGQTRLEQTHQAQSAGEQSLEFDTSSLTPGAYTVTIESWSYRASHSFVVLR